MKHIPITFLGIVLSLLFVSCGNNVKKTSETYLSRDVSFYSTPTGDAFGLAVKLNRDSKSYTLFENSSRNQQWRATKSGRYSETIEDNVAICDLNIDPERFGDVYEVRVYLNSDKAALISLSGKIEVSPCNSIE